MPRALFLRVVVATWWVYASVGLLIPLLPQYIAGRYGGGGIAVGVTVLVYGVASVVVRPAAGHYLRRHDPWRLMVLSVVIGVAALVATPLAGSLGEMLLLRFVDGAAVGAFYTASATAVVAATPHDQRGRVLSYFSVPLFLGVASGPVAGDWLIAHVGDDSTWVAAGITMTLALLTCTRRRSDRDGPSEVLVSSAQEAPHANLELTPPPVSGAGPPRRRSIASAVLHPAALWPGAVFGLSIMGYAGFQAFVPLYGPTIGLPVTGTVFLVYSVTILALRVGGAHVIDVLPPIELVLAGCVANVAGLVLVWAWPGVPALYGGAVLMAFACAVQYALLMKLSLTGVDRREQGGVVATYSASYDVGAGAGALLVGAVASATGSYRTAFLAGALCGVAGGLVLITRFWSHRHDYARPGTPLRSSHED
jgi:MFS family permease